MVDRRLLMKLVGRKAVGVEKSQYWEPCYLDSIRRGIYEARNTTEDIVDYNGGEGLSIGDAVIIKGKESRYNGVFAEECYINKIHGERFEDCWKYIGQKLYFWKGIPFDAIEIVTKEEKHLTYFFNIEDFYPGGREPSDDKQDDEPILVASIGEGWDRTAKWSEGESPLYEIHRHEQKECFESVRSYPDAQVCLGGEVEQKEFSNSIGMRFVKIPGKDYYIGKYQVMQKEWRAIMGSNPSKFIGDERPVEMVSWDDCQGYIERLNRKEDTYKYRLPTKDEWEHACRAGSTTNYYFGDDCSQLGNYAWYEDNSGSKTHFVGTKMPNKWGLHDMLGNVWEWCQDRGYEHECREYLGGGWDDIAEWLDLSYWWGSTPDFRNSYVGVRLVRKCD